MSILANVRELLDAVLPPAQATATQATPVAPAMPTGTIPRKKRNQALIVGGVVVLVIGFFIFHHPTAQEPVVRSRSQNTQPTTTLTPEQVNQTGLQLATDTRVAIEHENQLKNLSVAQFGNDPANTGMVDPNTGQRMNSNAQEAANYQTQAPAQTGPTPEQIRHERETQLAKALHASPYIPPTAMSGYEKPGAPPASPQANQSQDATSDATARREASPVKATPNDTLSRYEGPLHRLLAGKTVLRGVLVHRIEGSYTGPVVVQLTDDVFTLNREQLLAKAGTILFGEARAVSGQWQSRVDVRFNRIIMPDGFSAQLSDAQGLSQRGEAGVSDKVNRHYGSTFAAALLLGGLGALTQRNNGFSGYAYDPATAMRNGISTSMGQSAEKVLERSMNRPPTLEIREGTRVTLLLSDDLTLPEYKNHRIDPNL
jgi:type IV secretory pathway VirB10-like protein